MKRILIAGFVFMLTCICYSNSSRHQSVDTDTTDTITQADTSVQTDLLPEEFIVSDTGLLPFKAIIDTLNTAGDELVHSTYFMYDITGDGQPEFWVKSGSCEADIMLSVYTYEKGKLRKILSQSGGHTDLFLKGDTIGSVTCHCGAGKVSIYSYKGGKIKVKSAEFSTFNEEGEAKAIKKKEQALIRIWDESDTTIEFKNLK